MSHTPTPWFSAESWRGNRPIYHKPKVGPRIEICRCSDPDEAEFIVRACNSHDALVEALEAITMAATIDVPRTDAWLNLINTCRATLAAAKGDSQ